MRDDAIWETCWHGCKFQALYSIMYHGGLASSSDKKLGHRYFPGMAGIYLHRGNTAYKADHYIRFTPVCGDGVFWAAKWEVRADLSKQASKHKGDQWIQMTNNVRLVALWLCGRRYQDMVAGTSFDEVWNPILEAKPRLTHTTATLKFFCRPVRGSNGVCDSIGRSLQHDHSYHFRRCR